LGEELYVPTRARNFSVAAEGAVAWVAAALVVGVGIGTPLLGLTSFSGVDLLQSYEPWRSGVPTGVRPHLPAVSDTVDVVLPGHQLFRNQLGAGNLADWNPLVSGGTAFGSGTVLLPFLAQLRQLDYLADRVWSGRASTCRRTCC
jgi:hypothetical protein